MARVEQTSGPIAPHAARARLRVRVAPEVARHAAGLLAVLEHVTSADFSAPAAERHAACVIVDGQPVPSDAPVLSVPPVDAGGEKIVSRAIRFDDSDRVPWPWRGRTLSVPVELDATVHAALRDAPGALLATDDAGSPVWRVYTVEGIQRHCTSLCLPQAPDGGDITAAAGAERLVQSLPLLHFLREAAGERALSNPRLRASYIVDDPNLHWPTYGHADFRRIAESARRHGFHVAFATIPLDSWWVHPGAAAIFRDAPDVLSLLVHGNNHARQELAQAYSHAQGAALLAQAQQRIGQLEARSGLRVSRVMVPPHGACSARMLAEMPRQGFEAACVSAGSLRAHNPGCGWSRTLGFAPVEHVEGCPVLPRWSFTGISDAALLAAAYLGQPLVLRGHHQDLRDGLEIMERHAAAINALGHVHWGDLAAMSRASYRHRRSDSLLEVDPIGHRLDIQVPADVDTLRLLSNDDGWSAAGVPLRAGQHGDGLVVRVEPGSVVPLARVIASAHASTPRARATNPGLVVRRVLTETRDRLRIA